MAWWTPSFKSGDWLCKVTSTKYLYILYTAKEQTKTTTTTTNKQKPLNAWLFPCFDQSVDPLCVLIFSSFFLNVRRQLFNYSLLDCWETAFYSVFLTNYEIDWAVPCRECVSYHWFPDRLQYRCWVCNFPLSALHRLDRVLGVCVCVTTRGTTDISCQPVVYTEVHRSNDIDDRDEFATFHSAPFTVSIEFQESVHVSLLVGQPTSAVSL